MQDFDESFVLCAQPWQCNLMRLNDGQHFHAWIFTLNYTKAGKSL